MRRTLDAKSVGRDEFLAAITSDDLAREQAYRDSEGSLFTTTLHEMLLQYLVHSTHHRAKAVNMIRCVGGPGVEVDFMYSRRRPAP